MRGLVGLVATLLLAFSAGASAQIYKHCDKDGNCRYSDQPTQDAEKVEVETVVSEFTTARKTTSEQADAAASQVITSDGLDAVEANAYILSPSQKETIRANDGRFDVSWGADIIGLASQPIYQLWVDGKMAYSGPLTQVTLNNVDRGERRLQVRVTAADGTELARSDVTVVYVMRASVINPAGAAQNGS